MRVRPLSPCAKNGHIDVMQGSPRGPRTYRECKVCHRIVERGPGALYRPDEAPPQLVTDTQQKAGEAAYLESTKYKSAVADYPRVVRAILEAALRVKS